MDSKPSYTKFSRATRILKRMKAVARFKTEIWCIDLLNLEKLAKDINGVKYLLVHQEMFDRTVDAKTMKTNGFKETVGAFLTMITKENQFKKN